MSPPTISAPKGGGAMRGIGEKVSVNAASGTANISVPLYASPGRDGFGPTLALSYSSGHGNGPFGFGWQLSLPAITRKTEKGLPRYRDADVFVLSGTEDLVAGAETVRDGYRVRRYRPRLEGAFARIERWSRSGDVHWRTTSRDNVTTIFGRTDESRIVDPNDPERIFSWLACESYDGKGNAIVFEYAREDGSGIDRTAIHERNRTVGAARYLARIRYGNRTPHEAASWMFEVAFDYEPRPDAFSTYRAGFEIRTYRRCRRVRMLHQFAELGAAPLLVRSTDLAYDAQPAGSFLRRVVQHGHDGTQTRSLPALDLAYSAARIDDTVRSFDIAVDQPQWVDLDGEGIVGALAERGSAWYYQRNRGAVEIVATQPNIAAHQLVDLTGDGLLDVVSFDGATPGYFARTADGGWQPYAPFERMPNVRFADPNARLVDLTGDGCADLMVADAHGFTWYPSLGVRGFDAAERVPHSLDEERGPRLLFADGATSIYLADMSGDGLPDLVRVRNGEVCYWPNLGYGRFGAKVSMSGVTPFDAPERFDQRRVRLVDVDGSGLTDVLYLGAETVTIYGNDAGNALRPARTFAAPSFDSLSSVSVIDLLGTGTACLVWSSTKPADRGRVRYLDLCGSVKPYLLASIDNNLGARTEVTFAPSTKFYLADARANRPWVTRIPFPVQLVERVVTTDRWRASTSTQTYSYHHGYYDGHERELRGFGRVHQRDAEQFGELAQAPVETVTWFDTGALERVSLEHEYARPVSEHALGDHELPITPDDWRDARRACRGQMLRQEIYELDATGRRIKLFTTSARRCRVVRLAPRVFFTSEAEAIAYHYELDLATGAPDPRVRHSLELQVDAWGNALQSIAVTYPRRVPSPEATAQQAEQHVAYTERRFTLPVDDATGYHAPLVCDVMTFELTGITADVFTVRGLLDFAISERYSSPGAQPVANRAYHASPVAGPAKRLIERVRTLYFDDALVAPRALGESGARGLVYETYKLALTDALLDAVFDAKLTPALRAELASTRSGYLVIGDEYWIRSGIAELDLARFCLPVAYTDAFGHRTTLAYVHDLLVASTTDALQNTTVASFDLRVLAPARIIDPNDNVTEIAFDALGMPTTIALAGDSLGGTNVPFFEGAYDDADAVAAIANATVRHIYDFGSESVPARVATIRRERHVADGVPVRVLVDLEYSDGGGNVLVKKSKAEPAEGTTALRWIASGKTVLNNKGKPVKQYEPYFTSDPHYAQSEVGVTQHIYYDALGRPVRTVAPDGSYARVEFSPWHVARFDANDTLAEAGNAWLAAHGATRAAAAALVHANTPTIAHLDSLGREVVVVDHECHQIPGEAKSATIRLVTVEKLDAEGKPLWIRDPRGNLVMQYITPPMPETARTDVTTGYAPCYDLAGNLLFQHAMDAGDRWSLADATGKPLFAWDVNGGEARRFETRYDALHRPVETWVFVDASPAVLVERQVYGEDTPNDRARNLRGRRVIHDDAGGRSTTSRYDYAGRALEQTRMLAADYRAYRIDWQTAALEPEQFAKTTVYDALGRLVRHDNWQRATYEPRYNERGLLVSEDLVVRGTRTTVVDEIRYDAKGQRAAIRYGNGTRTRFTYDPETFRLAQLRTTRPNYDPAFPSTVSQFRDARVVQNLFYTYDPAGNVIEIYDDAVRPAFFANQQIEAIARYTYDSLYRLVAATGREHAGALIPTSSEPSPLASAFPIPALDAADQHNYRERYRYDEAGNLRELVHTPGWTRTYDYEAFSNRLVRTYHGNDPGSAISYPHDTHGNILAFANVTERLGWDDHDMLRVVPRGGGGTVYYQNGGKQRTRKVSETQNGTLAWQRIYLDGMEVLRRYANGVLAEEIETHHVFVADQRALLVDDVRITDRNIALGIRPRYQYANHLGSACLELDAAAAVISYEEFHPYGTAAYRFARGQIDVPKRYRFTGMERDDETGLSYHTARYYAPWLGRWASADPIGIEDGLNRYAYCRGSPTRLHDRRGTQATVTEAMVSARVQSFLTKHGWAFDLEVRFKVDIGGFEVGIRTDIYAHPPGRPSELWHMELKIDDPALPNSRSAWTKNQALTNEAIKAGKPLTPLDSRSNTGLKAGEAITPAEVRTVTDSSLAELEVEIRNRSNLPEVKARPPTIRRGTGGSSGPRGGATNVETLLSIQGLALTAIAVVQTSQALDQAQRESDRVGSNKPLEDEVTRQVGAWTGGIVGGMVFAAAIKGTAIGATAGPAGAAIGFFLGLGVGALGSYLGREAAQNAIDARDTNRTPIDALEAIVEGPQQYLEMKRRMALPFFR